VKSAEETMEILEGFDLTESYRDAAELVGFQKSATAAEQGLHAARSYSLIKPSRTGRHLIPS
jgi:hypothetical protein